MSSSTTQITNTPAEIVVETNNFRQVAKYFNDVGGFTNPRTRVIIECQICQGKHLGLANLEFNILAPDSHEKYAVLPRCGHAFGYDCLHEWISTQTSRGIPNPTCPTCRSKILCRKRHPIHLTEYGSNNMWRQGAEIIEIRSQLLNVSCSRCLEEGQNPQRARDEHARALLRSSQIIFPSLRASQSDAQQTIAQRLTARQPEAIQPEVRHPEVQQPEARPPRAQIPPWVGARQRDIQATIQAGAAMRSNNQETWDEIEYQLFHMHAMVQQRNQRVRPGFDMLEISMARENLQESIRNRGHGNDEESWDDVEARLFHIRDMAEDRIEWHQRSAAVSQQIQAQIRILEGLMRENNMY